LTPEPLQQRIAQAAASRRALRLRGGGTKDFYGGELRGEILDVRDYRGIVSYEPTELVVTARCGTPLVELEARLAEHGQCLPFEPPHFGAGATFGGCIATGLSGPRRAAAGAVRDFVLGTKVIDGRGRLLSFGGQVMKNVAGYDVSRLMAGSLGTLALIAEASLKVLPKPQRELTLELELSEERALDALNAWGAQPLPISASAWQGGVLALRLSGADSGVRAAARNLGGGESAAADALWGALREHRAPFFEGSEPLWRISVPSSAAPLALPGRQLIEWGGALRWLKTDTGADQVRGAAKRCGGHATLFRGGDRSAGAFSPLGAEQMRLHRELKAAFDPAGVLNPGRLYPEL
jgi:glycolate oxidase FAD binding subunit